MRKKKLPTEEETMSAEPVNYTEQPQLQVVPKKLSTLQKVKLANQIIEAVESKAIRDAFLSMSQGEIIHKIFIEAAEKHVESLMGNEAIEEDLSLAQQKVEDIVNSCVKLQQALVQSVRSVVGQPQQQQRPPQQQQRQPQQQQQQARRPQPQQAAKAAARMQPIYESGEAFQDEDDALLY
jgi:hypothetical protein